RRRQGPRLRTCADPERSRALPTLAFRRQALPGGRDPLANDFREARPGRSLGPFWDGDGASSDERKNLSWKTPPAKAHRPTETGGRQLGSDPSLEKRNVPRCLSLSAFAAIRIRRMSSVVCSARAPAFGRPEGGSKGRAPLRRPWKGRRPWSVRSGATNAGRARGSRPANTNAAWACRSSAFRA